MRQAHGATPGPIDPLRIFVCGRCHAALEVGRAAPVKWLKGPRTSLPATCQRCLDARKKEPAQKKLRQATAQEVLLPPFRWRCLTVPAAIDLLGILSGGSYLPSDAVVKTVQEMIDVMAAEPEVFWLTSCTTPCWVITSKPIPVCRTSRTDRLCTCHTCAW